MAQTIKRSVRSMPSTPASAAAAAAAAAASEDTGMISRLTLDVHGQGESQPPGASLQLGCVTFILALPLGKVLVFAENRQGELSQHRVQIAATASAADVVKALLTPVRAPDYADDSSFIRLALILWPLAGCYWQRRRVLLVLSAAKRQPTTVARRLPPRVASGAWLVPRLGVLPHSVIHSTTGPTSASRSCSGKLPSS